MKFTDAIVEYQTDLTPEFMAGVIERFESDERTLRGRTGAGIDQTWKQSQDLFISDLDDWKKEDSVFFESITDIIQQYHVHMNSISESYSLGTAIADLGYQLQRTRVDEYYHWHHDFNQTYYELNYINSCNTATKYATARVYTYIVYLNDRIGIEDGRTQFKFGEEVISIEPRAGKCLMFPANVLYTHRGETLLTGEKYLMTGWVTVPNSTSEATPTDDDLEFFKRVVATEGGQIVE